MLKYSPVYLFISIILFSCTGSNHPKVKTSLPSTNNQLKVDSVEGLFSSASISKLIYIKPENWEGDEVTYGTLFMRDLKTGENKKVLDSIDAYKSYSSVLNNDSFIICSYHEIYCYSDRASKKTLIFKVPDGEYIEMMNLSPNKKTVAFLTSDIKENNIHASLYLYNVDKRTIIYQKNFDYKTDEGDEGISTSIKWINKNFAFNINNDLYLFDFDSKQASKITNSLAYSTVHQYAADSAILIYYQFTGNQGSSSINYFDFKRKESGNALFNLSPDSLKLKVATSLSSPIIDGNIEIFLRQGKSVYQLNNRLWEKAKQEFLFKNSAYQFSNLEVGEKNYILVDRAK